MPKGAEIAETIGVTVEPNREPATRGGVGSQACWEKTATAAVDRHTERRPAAYAVGLRAKPALSG